LGIEVDGNYWHRNRLKEDKNKNQKLIEMGVELIRVRGNGLDKIPYQVSKSKIYYFMRWINERFSGV
jgi:very-short-patch-repair endonuclease